MRTLKTTKGAAAHAVNALRNNEQLPGRLDVENSKELAPAQARAPAATMGAPDLTIATIAKNHRDEFRILLREFKGAKFIDVRLYTLDARGQLIPTRTGITVRPALLRAVIEALEKAEEAAKAEGLQ
jgi:hypothetical protein